AKAALEQALAEAGQDSAAERAARDGQIGPQQQQAAEQAMQQASAAREQQAAAEAVQRAMDAIRQNQPMSKEQQQKLAEMAKQQQQLAEDIVRLAEELKKRENKPAERAAEQAADAARKAQRAMEQGDEDAAQQQQQQAREKLEEAAQQLDEEKDRYQDLRQEELLFRMKEELTALLDKQRPMTAATLEAQAAGAELSRPVRRKLNQLGEEEQGLAAKVDLMVKALSEEGSQVYRAVLQANLDDLGEIARRLAGRNPDPGRFTTLMQQDVERRTEQLLAALEKERQRREQDRQQQQQQQGQPNQSKNRFNEQRKKLVSLIAELEMLKQLGVDTRRATDDLRALVDANGGDAITDAEVALIERLANRHAEITKLFAQIKQGVEQSLQAMQGGDDQGQGTGR
ncbi:MAG: hypothetical protein K8J09_22690, partial [Planctomycetes bacterium]|nr:hypothetical protein [Planctomycetota bacterium]